MTLKTPADFNYDYDKYVEYRNSAQSLNDEGITHVADAKGNVYDSDDWTKGHGHRNSENGYNRPKDDPRSKGREWRNNGWW